VRPDGTWSCTPATELPEGDHTLVVTAEDPAGNASEETEVPVNIDTTAPEPPVIDRSNGTMASGSTDPSEEGSKVVVYDPDGNEICVTVVQADGTFACELEPPAQDGEEITVVITDPAGNPSEEATAKVVGLGIVLGSLQLYPGDDQSVMGINFRTGEKVTAELNTAEGPLFIATDTADAEGKVEFPTFAIPTNSLPGELTVTLSGELSGPVTAPFQVLTPVIQTGVPGFGGGSTGTGLGLLAGSALLATFLIVLGRKRREEGIEEQVAVR
jgi:hypothetical protein